MFLRRSEPILLTEDGLDGLCASLNRPVVHVAGLPVAPARAAIALHHDIEGQRILAVAVRFEDSGAVALFAERGELDSAALQAMDDGLAFAEGMGFLFDEDLVASGGGNGRQRAFECWCEIAGDDAQSGRSLPSGALASGAPGSPPLDDFDEFADLEEVSPFVDPAPGSGLLSKFRRDSVAAEIDVSTPAEASQDSESGETTAQLGRIAIVRRQKPQQGEASTPLLTRLLSRF